jgi:hypothetical protein
MLAPIKLGKISGSAVVKNTLNHRDPADPADPTEVFFTVGRFCENRNWQKIPGGLRIRLLLKPHDFRFG